MVGHSVRAMRVSLTLGAGLDVTDPEPRPKDHPLRRRLRDESPDLALIDKDEED